MPRLIACVARVCLSLCGETRPIPATLAAFATAASTRDTGIGRPCSTKISLLRNSSGRFASQLVEQVLQLRVQGDVTVGVQFAQRDVQPVGRTDLHDGVGGQRQVFALAHTGSSEELDGESHERVVVGAGGLQQLGRRGVVEEPGQGFVGDRHVGGQHRDFGWRVGDFPFEQSGEEPAQRAEPILDRVAMQRTASQGRPLGQPAFVGLDV